MRNDCGENLSPHPIRINDYSAFFGRTYKMKRVGFIFKIKQGLIPEYVEHHRHVWPEMQDALRRTGWHNYSIFLRPDGLLFGYFETPLSLSAAQEGMAKEEINAKWQAFMAPYFENLEGLRPDESMMELQEVFHLD
jgi:L-rhamnose mutarotase